MKQLKQLLNRQVQRDKDQIGLFAFDELTKLTAVKLSRRDFAKLVIATGAALGIPQLIVIPASASDGYCDPCHAGDCTCCTGSCSTCSSGISICCSPNGEWCRSLTCQCCCGCTCVPFRPRLLVYNNGNWTSHCDTDPC